MKIVLTGSLGHISEPLATELIKKGNEITIISSKEDKIKTIEVLGAKAAIGSIDDIDFLKKAFTGADTVYCMVPYPDTKQPIKALFENYIQLAHNYKTAIEHANIKQVVDLSTVGAHMKTGNGLLQYGYQIEKIFDQLPSDVHIKFMRPVSFYYNVLAYIPQIRQHGLIAANYGGETKKPWVSPIDIAAATAEAMLTPFAGREIKYIMSEELSCNQIAAILGAAIGKPDLQWNTIADDQMLHNFIQMGMEPTTAQSFVDMNAGIQNGSIYADYYKHQPFQGKVKFEQYAKQFAEIYHQ